MLLLVPLASQRGKSVPIALLLSTMKSCEQGNSYVDGVSDCSSEIRISAELLSQSDKDQRLDDAVDVAFHRSWPSVAERILKPGGEVAAGRG